MGKDRGRKYSSIYVQSRHVGLGGLCCLTSASTVDECNGECPKCVCNGPRDGSLALPRRCFDSMRLEIKSGA
eukprot:425241-Rhodomonas_salina.1